MVDHALLLLAALLVDAYLGDPDWLWRNIPHPVVLFGRLIDTLEQRFNVTGDDPGSVYRKGSMVIAVLIGGALLAGFVLQWLCNLFGVFGYIIEILVVCVFVAQRSLYDHVLDVARGLETNGIAGGRLAVAKIVGRDPEMLDEAGVSRAAIESLAENFSDGVIAPAFWYLIFGLPGLLAYKMINTADSMIAHKNERFLYFGRTAAKLDDLANWVPARISVFAIAFGGLIWRGVGAARRSIKTALADSGLHRSPNAGWPEAAMAGAANIALGGPRIYRDEIVAQAYINGPGRKRLGSADIRLTLSIYIAACVGVAILIALTVLVQVAL